MKIARLLLCWIIGVIFLGCEHMAEHGVGNAVNLDPNDPRPVLRISIDDGDEIDLLRQQLKVEPIYVKDGQLYLSETKGIREKLDELGYRPIQMTPLDVYERVVRIERRGAESEMIQVGVELINREPHYWIVRGTLAQLRALKRLGYQLGTLGPNEPAPREVRIVVPTTKDVQQVNQLHVDIYSVEETKLGIIIYGGAFDAQIDELKAHQYVVERMPVTKQEVKP